MIVLTRLFKVVKKLVVRLGAKKGQNCIINIFRIKCRYNMILVKVIEKKNKKVKLITKIRIIN